MNGKVNIGVAATIIGAVMLIAGFCIYRAAQPANGSGGIPSSVHPPAAYLRQHQDADKALSK